MDIKINFLPDEMKETWKKKTFFLSLLIITIFFFHGFTLKLILLQEKNNDQLKKEIANYNKSLAQIKKFKKQKKELLEQLVFFQTTRDDRFLNLNFLIELSKLIPKGAFLTQIKNKNKSIEMEGNALNAQVFTALREGIIKRRWLQKSKIVRADSIKSHLFHVSFKLHA